MIGEKLQQVKWPYLIIVISAIVLFGISYIKADQLLQNSLSGLSLWLRMIICSVLIFPIAVPMGIPFPSGLNRLRIIREDLIPWAWGTNGFFSVIGSSLAVIIAIEYGFVTVIVSALVLYAIAGIVYILMCVWEMGYTM